MGNYTSYEIQQALEQYPLIKQYRLDKSDVYPIYVARTNIGEYCIKTLADFAIVNECIKNDIEFDKEIKRYPELEELLNRCYYVWSNANRSLLPPEFKNFRLNKTDSFTEYNQLAGKLNIILIKHNNLKKKIEKHFKMSPYFCRYYNHIDQLHAIKFDNHQVDKCDLIHSQKYFDQIHELFRLRELNNDDYYEKEVIEFQNHTGKQSHLIHLTLDGEDFYINRTHTGYAVLIYLKSLSAFKRLNAKLIDVVFSHDYVSLIFEKGKYNKIAGRLKTHDNSVYVVSYIHYDDIGDCQV